MANIHASHPQRNTMYDLDINKSGIINIDKLGITKSIKVKRQIIISCFLRVDEIVKFQPTPKQKGR